MKRFQKNSLFTFAALLFWTPYGWAADAGQSAEQNKSAPLPIYASKTGKNGLFPEEMISMKEVRKAQERGQKLILLDARGKQSYDSLHISGAALPLTADYYQQEEHFRFGLVKSLPDRDKDLAVSMAKYPKDALLVTYCNDDCQASAVLLLQLKRLGFTKALAMTEGIQTWQAAGYSVVSADKF